jgi:undecaprenyl-diphosphatase
MTFIQLLVLGIVQGITEFLPISSSAHLILVPKIMHEADQGLLVDLGGHMGTLAAVMILFRHEVWRMILGFFDLIRLKKTPDANLFLWLFIGTIPGALVGFLLKDIEGTMMRHVEIIIFTSIFWGAVLWWVDRISAQEKTVENDLSLKRVLIVGLAQALAFVPGTSRSGITMTAARYLGFQRIEAARFSFLLSIPVTAGAVLLGLVDIVRGKASGESIHAFFTVAGISFITALFTIVFLLRWLRRFNFTPFVIYRICLGVILIWALGSGYLA